MLQPGEVFENYRIERELGQGAFAVVYLAQHGSGHHVALKVLKEGRSDDRFFREAKLLGELQSPHTVRLIDVGGRNGRPYMAFEYVRGETLEDRLSRVGAMPGGRVAHIMRQLLASLAEAHERGIVHRDVKPANIMLTQMGGDEDFVKVLDFGVAKPLEDVREVSVELTMAGQIIGTMRYMAPEQLKGQRKAVPASDVYAAGLIAYELLTARKAAAGEDAQVVLAQHLSKDPFILSDHLDVPFHFKRAFEQMMAKDLNVRPRDAGEALRSLDFVDDDPTTFDSRLADYGLGEELARERRPPLSQRNRAVDESLRIDQQALKENRARVTRGVTAASPAVGRDGPNVATILMYIGISIIVFSLIILVLTQLR